MWIPKNSRNVYHLTCGYNEMCWQFLLSAILFNVCDEKKTCLFDVCLCFSRYFTHAQALQTQIPTQTTRTHTIFNKKMLLLYAKIGKMWNVSVCIISFVCICITNDANAGKHFAQQTKRMITNQKYCTNKNPFHHRVCASCHCAISKSVSLRNLFCKKKWIIIGFYIN